MPQMPASVRRAERGPDPRVRPLAMPPLRQQRRRAAGAARPRLHGGLPRMHGPEPETRGGVDLGPQRVLTICLPNGAASGPTGSNGGRPTPATLSAAPILRHALRSAAQVPLPAVQDGLLQEMLRRPS